MPTAAADILAGAAVGAFSVTTEGGLSWHTLLPGWYVLTLVAISVLLYASGVVLNDYYDRDLDAIERPERPLPSGVVTPQEVALLGWGLALIALLLAASLGLQVLGLALLLMGFVWFYNYRAKENEILGPLFMGGCRALNLLLGMSPLWTSDKSLLALVPLVYIFAVTAVSRGEVHGGNRKALSLAGLLYLVAMLVLSSILLYFGRFDFVLVIGMLAFLGLVGTPLYTAWKEPLPGNIRKAVKAGVLSLVVLDAIYGLAFGGWEWALLILSMSILSLLFSRVFHVT